MKSVRATLGTNAYFLDPGNFTDKILQWYNCVPWKRRVKQNTRCREYRNHLMKPETEQTDHGDENYAILILGVLGVSILLKKIVI